MRRTEPSWSIVRRPTSMVRPFHQAVAREFTRVRTDPFPQGRRAGHAAVRSGTPFETHISRWQRHSHLFHLRTASSGRGRNSTCSHRRDGADLPECGQLQPLNLGETAVRSVIEGPSLRSRVLPFLTTGSPGRFGPSRNRTSRSGLASRLGRGRRAEPQTGDATKRTPPSRARPVPGEPAPARRAGAGEGVRPGPSTGTSPVARPAPCCRQGRQPSMVR
jgi:hypothetical protein